MVPSAQARGDVEGKANPWGGSPFTSPPCKEFPSTTIAKYYYDHEHACLPLSLSVSVHLPLFDA